MGKNLRKKVEKQEYCIHYFLRNTTYYQKALVFVYFCKQLTETLRRNRRVNNCIKNTFSKKYLAAKFCVQSMTCR